MGNATPICSLPLANLQCRVPSDPTQEERLLSVLGRGFSFAMRPLRQDGTLVGVIVPTSSALDAEHDRRIITKHSFSFLLSQVIQEGIFQARLLFRAPRCVSGKQKHPEGADHGIPLDSGSEGYIVLEHVVVTFLFIQTRIHPLIPSSLSQVCGIEESLSSSSTSFVSTHRFLSPLALR